MIRTFPRDFSKGLDGFANPWFELGDRRWSTYQICGYTGFFLSVLLGIVLTVHQGLLLWVLVGMMMTSVLTFFGLAMATKIIKGEERLIYYHHEIAIMAAVALLVWVLGQPVLPYLDVTILGIGLFLAFGRIGCLMVGCCHGRPHRWGVCYRTEHAEAGFPSYYVGVRLFPIQVVESAWVFFIVVVGSALILNDQPPGAALVWYVVMYDLGRFCFEFMRGDPERPYLWGFSEAQWISLGLVCIIVAGELFGIVTFHLWHIGVMAGLGFTMIVITLRRHFEKTPKYQLLHPHHVRDVAAALELASKPTVEQNAVGQWINLPKQTTLPTEVQVARTSLGIRISAGKITQASGEHFHVALSCENGIMPEGVAQACADLILQLRHAAHGGELIKGNHGVFHLLIRSPSQSVMELAR